MDNYKEIKNYIHNELKITKEEIRDMVIQTVREEVKSVLNDDSFIHTLVQNEIKTVMSNPHKSPNWKYLMTLDERIYKTVVSEVSKLVKNSLEIRFKNNEQEKK